MMSTKIGPLNQHEYLHPHYGVHDCCLCKEEERVRKYQESIRNFCQLLKEQKNVDPTITKLVNENFWELL